MKFTALQIAELIGGRVDGDDSTVVSSLSKIEEGVSESLSFLANPYYTHYLYSTKASVVIVKEDFIPEKGRNYSCALIRTIDPRAAFSRLLDVFNHLKNSKTGIETPSHISPTATLGKDVYIGAFAYIGEHVKIGNKVRIFPNAVIGDYTRIGDGTTVYAGARIYSECVIGSDCTIHAGVIIGGDGFGFAPNPENTYTKVPQIGNVIIEDRVEIGSNTTIDRATLGSTIIRKGVKLDNLIQIAHNVEIGENTVIAAQTGISGSVKIGKNCMIGGQVGIIEHIQIADGVMIAAQSGIGKSIYTPGVIQQGSPAFGIRDYKRSYVVFTRLPDLNQRVLELEKELNVLKQLTTR